MLDCCVHVSVLAGMDGSPWQPGENSRAADGWLCVTTQVLPASWPVWATLYVSVRTHAV